VKCGSKNDWIRPKTLHPQSEAKGQPPLPSDF
jgi:hypothetical protein